MREQLEVKQTEDNEHELEFCQTGKGEGMRRVKGKRTVEGR